MAPQPFLNNSLVPWSDLDIPSGANSFCNICRWAGESFDSPPHSEGSHCPSCGSIARERFLHWSWIRSWVPVEGARVIENSPRLGEGYRTMMSRALHYRGSDYDERAHQADIQLDLQDIDLPTSSLDVVLSTHVLEHVPNTGRALRELHRVLAPGGVVVLQVPLAEPTTKPPDSPEFHADDTPVFWRFGFDLADQLSDAGFVVETQVTERLTRAVASGAWPPAGEPADGPIDPATQAIVRSGRGRVLTGVMTDEEARLLGVGPDHMFVTWVATVTPDSKRLHRTAPSRVRGACRRIPKWLRRSIQAVLP
ncbi:MAG: class I SAM-dependent methyltransferase [Acidimicrobiales bacterium]|nr:class I SAM-dependent methyltransferase [Acidimicrobiales bacterium]